RGTDKVSSALATITANNVTIDDQTGCSGGTVTIMAANSGYNVMRIGNLNLTGTAPLAASTAELANNFQLSSGNITGLGIVAGSYIYLTEGGVGGNTCEGCAPQNSTATTCYISGCRAEVLKVASVIGTTVTVTTALHWPYNPVTNLATVQRLVAPTAGTFIHDLILDGATSRCTVARL